MQNNRTKIPIDLKQAVLHETGYQCGNPSCRRPLTLDIHHIEKIADGGGNDQYNLIALCPNCHAEHHRGIIPLQSIRAWKMLALSLNEGIGKVALNILLALDKTGPLMLNGEGCLQAAPLIAANMVLVLPNEKRNPLFASSQGLPVYVIELTGGGKAFVAAWKDGKQLEAVGQLGVI